MITISEAITEKEKHEYIKFIYDLYSDDDNWCDMNLLFVKNFLYQKDSFSKRVMVRPIVIKEDDKIKLECIFIIDETSEIKLSFLEFVPNAKEYFACLDGYARYLLSLFNKQKVIIGVNGQISYGLGILTGDYNQSFEFNSNHNKDYYTKELDDFFPNIKKAYSYKYTARNTLSLLDDKALKRLYSRYQFRYFNIKQFKKEILLFGKLCHESLKNTPYYADKTPYEMYELFKPLRFIIRKEDIIFVMKDGKEIGFIYTHPDYAELFDKPKINYIKFFLKFLFKRPQKIIYNAIGILPKYKRTGIAAALIDKSIRTRLKDDFESVSSFILEENVSSTLLSKNLAIGINKEFHLYEIQLMDSEG